MFICFFFKQNTAFELRITDWSSDVCSSDLSFWLADTLAMIGRRADAEKLFERLLGLRNDVGLLAEEYDTHLKRQCGNFPQAFSHVGLINTAYGLEPRQTGGPTRQTAEGKPDRTSQEPADAPDSQLA